MLNPTTGDDYRTQFTRLTDGWTVERDGLVGESPTYYSLPETKPEVFPDDPWTYFVYYPVNLWRYAVAGQPEWTDYTLTTTVIIEQPAPLKGFRPGNFFFNYQWGREAIGSDAGLMVRYQGPDDYYMVRLSSAYGHVELWKTHGGVVQVKPYAFTPRQAYTVSVTASGRWIIVTIDGKEIIRYADPLLPLRNGQVGIGVRESRVRFANVQVTPAEHIDTPVPAHMPNFHLRPWVGRDYIFDGDEPIGFLYPRSNEYTLCEVKLAPGLMPLIIPYVGMHTYEYLAEKKIKVTGEGKQFAFTTQLQGKDDDFVCDAAWEIHYDPAHGYVWDKRATVTVLKDKALAAWPELDDPFFYQLVAPVTDKLPRCSSKHNYCIKHLVDSKTVAYPNATHIWGDGVGGVESDSQMAIRHDGAAVTTVDGWGVLTEFPPDNTDHYTTGYCHWGLDLHLRTTAKHVPVKGETFSGHIRYSVWDPVRVRQELGRSILLPQAVKPYYGRTLAPHLIAHVEPINRCDRLYPGLTGEPVRLWTGNYTVDRTVGRGDATSMRIDTAAITNHADSVWNDERPNIWLGSSYWTGPYLASRYRFGIWVKAEQFTGIVAFIANGYLPAPDIKMPDPVRAELPIEGKCDWTYLSFDAAFPHQVSSWMLRIDPIGTGVIWVDDIEVTPLQR